MFSLCEVVLHCNHCDRYCNSTLANAVFVVPDYIAEVYRRLHLNQRQAVEIFGCRINILPRCENGKTQPFLDLVKLLKAFVRRADLLVEVRFASLGSVDVAKSRILSF